METWNEVEPQNTDIKPDAMTDDAEDTIRGRRSKAPSPQIPGSKSKKTPTHARLVDDTDAGLADRLVGRHFLKPEENVVDKKMPSPNNELTKSSLAVRLRNLHNKRRPKKRPSSARLLDDVDAGLMNSLAGRFETARYDGMRRKLKRTRKSTETAIPSTTPQQTRPARTIP